MKLFKKPRKHKIRIRVFEEDHYNIYLRSRSFRPAEKADFNTICLMLEKMGFRPSGKEKK